MKLLLPTIIGTAAFAIAGCDSQTEDGPPKVRLGESVCEECNMIISDRRWATATVIEGPRGPEALLFDDFNCQVNYETEHPDLSVHARWSHSHATGEPLRTEAAVFFMSPNLRTPMSSRVAAFASPSEAEEARKDLTGDVMEFDAAWKRLGNAGGCCNADDGATHTESEDQTDGS